MKSVKALSLFLLIPIMLLNSSGCGGSTSATLASGLQPVLQPGGTKSFRANGAVHVLPDDIHADTSFFPSQPISISVANDQTVPLSSFISSGYNFGRARALVIQSNDFSIQSGRYGDTVINTQFGGTVNIGGFLAIVGVGSATMEVSIRILDITDGVDNPRIVAVHPVETYEITNAMEIGADLAIGAQVGSATVGQAGIDLGIGMAIPFDRTIVRDRKDFGFTALLRRGHDYRFQVSAESKLEFGGTGGRGVVSFYNPLAPIPNEIIDPLLLEIPLQILDANAWLDSLDWPILDLELPALNLPTNVAQFTIPARNFTIPLPTGSINIRVPGVSPSIRPVYPAPFQSVNDSNDILEVLGFNTNVRDILAENINRPIPENPLLIRGIELKDLWLDLDNDDTADLQEIKALLQNLD